MKEAVPAGGSTLLLRVAHESRLPDATYTSGRKTRGRESPPCRIPRRSVSVWYLSSVAARIA
jgi:hypothetical protein